MEVYANVMQRGSFSSEWLLTKNPNGVRGGGCSPVTFDKELKSNLVGKGKQTDCKNTGVLSCLSPSLFGFFFYSM